MVKYKAYSINNAYENIEDIVIEEIARWFEDNQMLYEELYDIYEDNLYAIIDENIAKYGLEFFGYESYDDVDYYDMAITTLNDIFTASTNNFIYDYVYDISDMMLGTGWADKLAEREYVDEKDVIDTFYKSSKMPIYEAFVKYTGQMLKKILNNI